jgi:drug/metabolite transporter (DMT)-like permease
MALITFAPSFLVAALLVVIATLLGRRHRSPRKNQRQLGTVLVIQIASAVAVVAWYTHLPTGYAPCRLMAGQSAAAAGLALLSLVTAVFGAFAAGRFSETRGGAWGSTTFTAGILALSFLYIFAAAFCDPT